MISSQQDIEIPAPNRLACRFFYWVTVGLMRSTFESVYLKMPELLPQKASVIAFQNHHSWWDGIIPLFLSERYFMQRGQAFMEKEQIEKHRFFNAIGALSLDRSNARQSFQLIQATGRLLQSEPTILFLYPQGAIYPNAPSYFRFERGFLRLQQAAPDASLLAITTFVHQMWDRKPVLMIDLHPTKRTENIQALETITKERLLHLETAALNHHEGFKQVL